MESLLVLLVLAYPFNAFRIRSRFASASASKSSKRDASPLKAWSMDEATWPVVDFGLCQTKFGKAPVCLEMLFSHKGASASQGAFGTVGIVIVEQMGDSAFLELFETRGAEVAKVLSIPPESHEDLALETYHAWFTQITEGFPKAIVGEPVFMKLTTSLPADVYRELYWGHLTHIDENLRASTHIAEFLAYGTIGRQAVMFFKEEAVIHINSGGKVQSDLIGLTRSLDGRTKLAAALDLPSPLGLDGTIEAQKQWATSIVAAIGAQAEEGLQDFKRSCLHHNDIKGNNLIISSDGHVKYIDFGLSWDSCVEDHGLETRLKNFLPKPFVKSPSRQITAAESERDGESGSDDDRLKETLLALKAVLSCRFKSGIGEVTLGKAYHGLEEADLLETLTEMYGEDFAKQTLEILVAEEQI